MTLDQINKLDRAEVAAALLQCCGSQSWASQVVSARPFHNVDQLLAFAEETWWNLGSQDWLEAFSKHPRIGEKRQLNRWSTQEQSGMTDIEGDTSQKLGALNDSYFERFGWIYIVCATGKSSSELLSLLQNRISNENQEELRIAARELAKITSLRLRKLMAE